MAVVIFTKNPQRYMMDRKYFSEIKDEVSTVINKPISHESLSREELIEHIFEMKLEITTILSKVE